MNVVEKNFAVFFPLFFVVLWLAVTTILALLSGSFRLMAKISEPSHQTDTSDTRPFGSDGTGG